MTNVVNLFKVPEKITDPSTGETVVEQPSLSFNEIMRKNEETKEKLRKERLRANKHVLKSYRIK